jgi:hypothetical protein
MYTEWTSFRYESNQTFEFRYGLLEIINSTFIHWMYYHSNDSLIDHLSLSKDHNGVFERIFNERQHFISNNNYINDIGESIITSNKSSSKSSSSNRIKLMFLFLSILLLIVLVSFIVYIYLKRYLNYKKQIKINSNYSNLIESEFDT